MCIRNIIIIYSHPITDAHSLNDKYKRGNNQYVMCTAIKTLEIDMWIVELCYKNEICTQSIESDTVSILADLRVLNIAAQVITCRNVRYGYRTSKNCQRNGNRDMVKVEYQSLIKARSHQNLEKLIFECSLLLSFR